MAAGQRSAEHILGNEARYMKDHFDQENAIRRWRRAFFQHRAFDEGMVEEMEMHLRDHIEDLIHQGLMPSQAFDTAAMEFGEIPSLAEEEFSNIRSKTTFRSIIFTQMLKNYFKTTLRAFLKYPLSSFINLFGLSVAIGICLLSYAFYNYTYNIDRFHENRNEIFLTTVMADRDGTSQQVGFSPLPVGEALLNDFAAVQQICRIDVHPAVVRLNDQKVFYEKIRMADPSFFDMFSFPLKWGVIADLHDKSSIYLSEEMSEKYFGKQNPVGQELQIIFKSGDKRSFKVAGVAEKFPGTASFKFGFLINFDHLKNVKTNFRQDDWASNIDATFIKVSDPDLIAGIAAAADKYVGLQNDMVSDWEISSIRFQQLTSLYKDSRNIRYSIAGKGYSILYNSFISFVFIGIFVIILAASNYVNIAIVSASGRLKEIGLRKVIGASRKLIIFQFLAENLLLMTVALTAGVMLGNSIFVPWLEETIGFDMDFTLADIRLWIFLPGLLLITVMLSGLYPAVYISGFQAASIFRGTMKLGRRGLLTRAFLGFQIMLACVMISVAVLFTQNAFYQSERDWGYDYNSAVFVHVHKPSYYEKMEQIMSQQQNVLSISGSAHHLGRNDEQVVISLPERDFEVSRMEVSQGYFETMGLEILQGRVFPDNAAGSISNEVVINETFARQLNLTDPIGKRFKKDSVYYTIAGMVRDFHSYNFHRKVTPLYFTEAADSNYKFLTVKSIKGSEGKVKEAMKAAWASLYPEIPFDGGYQEETWGRYFDDIHNGSKFWSALAVIVLLLAGLGLYGLIALNASGRSKEFSIRKVLGAGTHHIGYMVIQQYLVTFIIAITLGLIVSYYLTDMIFNAFYQYHMPIGFSFALFSLGILSLVIFAIVFWQVRRIRTSNPSEGLRSE